MPEDLEEGQEEQSSSNRPFWSGTITFGLVSIPVNLYPGNRQARVPMRMLGPEGQPLARRYFSSQSGKMLDEDEIVRGYEIEKGKYVLITDDELDRVAPEKSRDIDLRLFIDIDAIPPFYFERSYFLTPAGPSAKAYRLLAATMEEMHRAGIATFVMRGKEYLVAILAENGILRAETLRFADELRSPADIDLPSAPSVEKSAVQRFQKLIDKHTVKELPLKELEDQSGERLLELARKKQSGNKDVRVARKAEKGKKAGAEVIDILEVLRRSLSRKTGGGDEESKPARRPAKREQRPRTASRSGAKKR